MATQVLPEVVCTIENRPPYRGELSSSFLNVLRGLDWPSREASARLRTLALTSSCRGEGVSTLAAHLAATAAACDAGPVLLVDGNLDRPTLHELFSLSPRPGLTECLAQRERWPRCIGPSCFANLSVLGAGQLPGSAARWCQCRGLPELVEELSHEFELVVFDLPPVGQQSCLSRLARLLDAVLLVVEAQRVCCDTVQRAKELLVCAEAPLAGVLLNKHHQRLAGRPRRTVSDEIA
ncbi:MAG: CpsD/CapB family tyrosine-protein kinase [Pirellulales bacterium]|nr:CpsD/CapB family tyrosine-protein kinase [Pirellulales bacterium]